MKCILFILIINTKLQAQEDLTKLSYKVIDSFVVANYKQHNYNQAVLYSKAGKDKAKAEHGILDTIFAEYTSNLVFFYKALGQYKKAEKCLLQTKSIVLQVQEKDHPANAIVMNNLAGLYRDIKRHLEVEKPIYLATKGA